MEKRESLSNERNVTVEKREFLSNERTQRHCGKT